MQLDEVDAVGRNTLHHALAVHAAAPDSKLLPWLVANGADVNAAQHGGMWQPLHLACMAKHSKAEAVVKQLIAARAHVSAEDSRGQAPLHLCASHGLEKVKPKPKPKPKLKPKPKPEPKPEPNQNLTRMATAGRRTASFA